MPPPRRLLALAAAAALAGCGPVGGPGGDGAPAATDTRVRSADAECPGADVPPRGAGDERFRAAVSCLLDAERDARGLAGLDRNDTLARAAQAHSNDMAERGYFAHAAPDGDMVDDRALAAGYTRRGFGTWRVGENLGYGTGPLATPRRLTRGWMESPGHRANILREGFRDLGVGVALGSPGGGRPEGAIATTVFGARGG